MGLFSEVKRTTKKTGNTMEQVGSSVPEVKETLQNVNRFVSRLDGIPGRCVKTLGQVGEEVSNTSRIVGQVAKIGCAVTGLKCLSDIGMSWYQCTKLTSTAKKTKTIANEANNAFKTLAAHTIQTENAIVNVLKNTSAHLTSFTGQCTETLDHIDQNFANLAQSLSKSAQLSSESNMALSRDVQQISRPTIATHFALTTSALTATLIYLHNSACNEDPEGLLCQAPLKSLAATAIVVTGSFVLKILMPHKEPKQPQDHFLIPEEGIDQKIEWTQEELDTIQATHFDVFTVIKTKKKFGDKWSKQDLEWLLSQDKNIFLKVLLR